MRWRPGTTWASPRPRSCQCVRAALGQVRRGAWLALILSSTRTPIGTVVLLVGGGVSFAAYRAMLRIARLPTERRVLR